MTDDEVTYAKFLDGRRGARKEENLKRAKQLDDGLWTKHNQWHWSRLIDEGGPYSTRLDYWPSTDKYRLDDLEHQPETKGGAYEFITSLGIGSK